MSLCATTLFSHSFLCFVVAPPQGGSLLLALPVVFSFLVPPTGGLVMFVVPLTLSMLRALLFVLMGSVLSKERSKD